MTGECHEMKHLLPALVLLLAAFGAAALARAQWRRGTFAPLAAWWRGASLPARAAALAVLFAAFGHGAEKSPGLLSAPRLVSALCTNAFAAIERLTGYAVSEARTNEIHDLTMPDGAQVADDIARRGAHIDGFWLFDAFTNRVVREGLDLEKPVWVQTDGTITVRSTARGIPFEELALVSTYSNVTVYAPLQGSYGFLPGSLWPAYCPSRIWTAVTDAGSRVVTWENALRNRDVADPVSIQAEFLENGDIIYRYAPSQTNVPAIGLFRHGAALTLATNNLPLATLLLTYIGDLGDGTGDFDSDGLADWEEVKQTRTDPRDADTDGDGLADGEDFEPNNWDADNDGVPDGDDPQEWAGNSLRGEIAGATNVVITIARGMSRTVRSGGLSGGGTWGGAKTGLLEIGGFRVPLYQGESVALSLPTGTYIPYRLHIVGGLTFELGIDYLGDGGLWCDSPDIFSQGSVHSSCSGRIALPTLSLEMTPSGLSRCVHEHPGFRDYAVSLAPMAWNLARASAAISGFEEAGGLLRLSVEDEPTSVAYGVVEFSVPWLRRGRLTAEASIHRCEYDAGLGYCPHCGEGLDDHDTNGVRVAIEKGEYAVLRGAVSPALVRLSADSSSTADWSISPAEEGGAKLHASPNAPGVYAISGTAFVWVSAGSNDIYTVTARHPEAADVSDAATITPVDISLELLWETRNKANQIFNRTPKDDDTDNLAVLEKEGDCSYAAPRNNLYVVANPSNETFDVTAHLRVAPARLADTVVCKAFNGSGTIAGSEAELNAKYKAVMEIPAPSSAVTVSYDIRAGIEMDGESGISRNETVGLEVYRSTNVVPRYAVLRGISGTQYQEHDNVIHGKLHFLGQNTPSFPVPFARSFLSLFINNGSYSEINPAYRPDRHSTVAINAFSSGTGFTEWLTHNSGASFSEAGFAQIEEYEWDDDTEVSQFIALRTPFAPKIKVSEDGGHFTYVATETGSQLLAFYNAELRQNAEAALANASPGESLTLPATNGWYELPLASAPNLFKSLSPTNSPTWVTPSTQVIGQDDGCGGYSALFTSVVTGGGQFDEYDAFGTIGRGRVVDPKYRFVVTKIGNAWPVPDEIKVTAIKFSCSVQDLYDFNYEDGNLPQHAAALQIGRFKECAPLRLQGTIFRHKIYINKVYECPFDYFE